MRLFLANPKILLSSSICLIVTCIIALFIVNPAIDGADGSGVLALQLAFDKQLGSEIIAQWGEGGRKTYLTWGFIDYLYAVSYALFLAALLSALIDKTRTQNYFLFKTPHLSLVAGSCDWLENIMELFFVLNPQNFPRDLFFFHSIIAVCKWILIAIVLSSLLMLAIKWLVTSFLLNKY